MYAIISRWDPLKKRLEWVIVRGNSHIGTAVTEKVAQTVIDRLRYIEDPWRHVNIQSKNNTHNLSMTLHR